MMAPVVYFTLATILATSTRRPAVKLLLFAFSALLVLGIGVSRVYLGVHWPSDVVAGWTLGAVIALLASIALLRTASASEAISKSGPIQPDIDSE